MEHRRSPQIARFPLCGASILCLLCLLLCGCQSARAPKPVAASPLSFSSYLYSIYDTQESVRPQESVKEDRLALKRHATVVVARLGEFAPRKELLDQLRAATNLFSRVEGVPAVPSGAGANQAQVGQETVKEHILKMRQLAVDIGADYIYLLGGDYKEYTAIEFYQFLDLTIVGYYLIGSNRVEVDSRGSGALVDVPTGRVLSVVTDEQRFIDHVPSAAFENSKKRDPEKAAARLEESLTQKLIEQLEARLAGSK